MNAFTRAAAALHADPNLSVTCTYKPYDAPMTPNVRIIRSSPVEEFGEIGGRGGVARREEASILVTAIATTPKPEDQIAIGRDCFLVEKATLDPEGTSWILTLSRS